jgi:hypothetical protein
MRNNAALLTVTVSSKSEARPSFFDVELTTLTARIYDLIDLSTVDGVRVTSALTGLLASLF